MDLQIKDRLYIPTFLPQKGNFKQFNLKKEILRKIEISENERQEVGLTENTETKRIEWDVTKDIPLNAEFSADELAYLKRFVREAVRPGTSRRYVAVYRENLQCNQ